MDRMFHPSRCLSLSPLHSIPYTFFSFVFHHLDNLCLRSPGQVSCRRTCILDLTVLLCLGSGSAVWARMLDRACGVLTAFGGTATQVSTLLMRLSLHSRLRCWLPDFSFAGVHFSLSNLSVICEVPVKTLWISCALTIVPSAAFSVHKDCGLNPLWHWGLQMVVINFLYIFLLAFFWNKCSPPSPLEWVSELQSFIHICAQIVPHLACGSPFKLFSSFVISPLFFEYFLTSLYTKIFQIPCLWN